MRIASIEEDMCLLREQMKNCWREGCRIGEAGTNMGMGGPNMGDAGHSMGEDEPASYHHEPSMYDDQHTMYHDEPNMVKEEPRMSQDLSLFLSGQEGHSMSHEDCTTAEQGRAMGLEDSNMGHQGQIFLTPQLVIDGYLEYNVHDGENMADVGTSSRSPSVTSIRSYVHYIVRFASLDFGKLYKLVTV